jgi:hypothetical protein
MAGMPPGQLPHRPIIDDPIIAGYWAEFYGF